MRYNDGDPLTRYTYTGQYSHADTFGLLFYNARYYSPLLGRFVSADTVTPPGAQGLDRYAYVNNNPLKYTDPSGHCVVGGHEMPDEAPACQGHRTGNFGYIRPFRPPQEDPGVEPLPPKPAPAQGSPTSASEPTSTPATPSTPDINDLLRVVPLEPFTLAIPLYVYTFYLEYRVSPTLGHGQVVVRPDSISLGPLTADEDGYYSIANIPLDLYFGNIHAQGQYAVGGTFGPDTIGVLLSWEGVTETKVPEGTLTLAQEYTSKTEWHPRNGLNAFITVVTIWSGYNAFSTYYQPNPCFGICR